MAETGRNARSETGDAGLDDAALDRILAAWRCQLRCAVDAQPRAGDRGMRERALVRALLAYANEAKEGAGGTLTPGTDERLESLALAAALYGVNMPREGLDPQTLCNDLSELREAVWQQIRARELPSERQTALILRFDQALSIALRAALTGGFRLSPPDGRVFAETIDEVIADCSSLRPPKP